MNVSDFEDLAQSSRLKAVNFVESGCGPMVIEVESDQGTDLIRDRHGEIITCQNVSQAYAVCQKAGVHEANLVQVIPHDETCSGVIMDYHRDSIPLKF